MEPRRGHAKLAGVLVACAAAVGGVIAALVVANHGHESTALPYQSTALAPTTGTWSPITVARPKVPIIAGGIPVDIDPVVTRYDFSSTLFPLGPHRYRMTVFNTSNIGAINSFQWYPPTGVHIVKLLDDADGHCSLAGLSGFGGKQFPTIVLNPNILCDKLDLKAPSCTCLGDGGSMTISFVTDDYVTVGSGDLRLRSATLPFDKVPTFQEASAKKSRPLMRVATTCVREPGRCESADVDSGGLTARDEDAAQRALDALQNSNISFQLVAVSRWVQSAPAACRIHVVSRDPSRYEAYVFWIPWLAAQPYVWLTMSFSDDPRKGSYHLGAAQPVLPGGRLKPDGQTVNRRSVDTTLLSRYGAEQAKKSREIMLARGGDAFAKPGAMCQVLKNGSLRLVPNR